MRKRLFAALAAATCLSANAASASTVVLHLKGHTTTDDADFGGFQFGGDDWYEGPHAPFTYGEGSYRFDLKLANPEYLYDYFVEFVTYKWGEIDVCDDIGDCYQDYIEEVVGVADVIATPTGFTGTFYNGPRVDGRHYDEEYDHIIGPAYSVYTHLQRSEVRTNPGSPKTWYDFSITRLGAIPEPGTWSLLITGFGLTGAALRRRRLVAA